MLYIIGLGLNNKKDISLHGLAAVKSCDKVYLESYTSQFTCSKESLESFYEKEIITADRSLTESKTQEILDAAKTTNVAFLIVGAPLAATTHMDLFLQAKQQKINVEVIENASVLTAVGITGLSLYKFGRITTIPLDNEHITSPYEVLQANQQQKLHTLLLLDIKEDKLMSVREGLDYLIKQGLPEDTLVIGCGGLGSHAPDIKAGKASEITISQFPQCILVPSELHFKEEEAINLYK